ncbi:MAG: hypothetical protein ACK5QI_01730 [Alphaproteobacteria bacterium]
MVDERTKKPPDKPVTYDADPEAHGAESRRKPRSFETSGETSSMEEYLYGKGLYAKGADQLTWGDKTRTRVLIRLVSRGIFGAVAFTLGGRYANKVMLNYDATKWKLGKDTPILHTVAKGFDTLLGKPIFHMVRAVAGESAAQNAVWFKPTAYLGAKGGKLGRSLGAEMVVISFDFSCASAADAFTRNLIQVADPNIKKPWLDDHGKFDGGKLVSYLGSTSWRVLTKNAGEDWAAAFPYVYQMRLQRKLLDKAFPGFAHVSDHAWNGGSYKINTAGKITGDYQWPGALDLQGRFVGYNWYTLMYRECYDTIGRYLQKSKEHGFSPSLKMPEHPVAGLVDGARDGLRYVIKSFIKANLYMQPAVPFFWLFRTPQTKWRASPVHPTLGQAMTAANVAPENTSNKRLFQGGSVENIGRIKPGQPLYVGNIATHSHDFTNFNPHAWEHQKTLTGKLLNPFGWLSYQAGNGLTNAASGLIKGSGRVSQWLGHGHADREKLLRGMVDASFSYTPYMIAKAEFGLRVDDRPNDGGLGKMDKAIYKAMDSLTALKFREFGRDVGAIKDIVLGNIGQDISARESGLVSKTTIKAGDGSVIPKLSARPETRVEKSSVIDEHRAALTPSPEPTLVDRHREALSGERKPATQNWSEYLGEKKKNAQLLASHPTVQ